jgi:hypothetical protein
LHHLPDHKILSLLLLSLLLLSLLLLSLLQLLLRLLVPLLLLRLALRLLLSLLLLLFLSLLLRLLLRRAFVPWLIQLLVSSLLLRLRSFNFISRHNPRGKLFAAFFNFILQTVLLIFFNMHNSSFNPPLVKQCKHRPPYCKLKVCARSSLLPLSLLLPPLSTL